MDSASGKSANALIKLELITYIMKPLQRQKAMKKTLAKQITKKNQQNEHDAIMRNHGNRTTVRALNK